jgi:hypothetical protein
MKKLILLLFIFWQITLFAQKDLGTYTRTDSLKLKLLRFVEQTSLLQTSGNLEFKGDSLWFYNGHEWFNLTSFISSELDPIYSSDSVNIVWFQDLTDSLTIVRDSILTHRTTINLNIDSLAAHRIDIDLKLNKTTVRDSIHQVNQDSVKADTLYSAHGRIDTLWTNKIHQHDSTIQQIISKTANDSLNKLNILSGFIKGNGAGNFIGKDSTGLGNVVLQTTPTITSPVITNINPGAKFTLTNNSISVFTSENTGALANTLYLKTGFLGIGTNLPLSCLHIKDNSVVPTLGYLSSFHADDNQIYLAGFFNDTYSTTVPVFEYFGYNTSANGFVSGDFEMGTSAAKKIGLYTNGIANPRITIDGSGLVGVGTTAAITQLHMTYSDATTTPAIATNGLLISNTNATTGSGVAIIVSNSNTVKNQMPRIWFGFDDKTVGSEDAYIGLNPTKGGLNHIGQRIWADSNIVYIDDVEKTRVMKDSVKLANIKITGLATGTAITDAINFQQLLDSSQWNLTLSGLKIKNKKDTAQSNVFQVGYSTGYIYNLVDSTYNKATGAHIWNIGVDEKMRLNENGNIGIGTISPSEKLEVDGDIMMAGATGDSLKEGTDYWTVTTAGTWKTGSNIETSMDVTCDTNKVNVLKIGSTSYIYDTGGNTTFSGDIDLLDSYSFNTVDGNSQSILTGARLQIMDENYNISYNSNGILFDEDSIIKIRIDTVVIDTNLKVNGSVHAVNLYSEGNVSAASYTTRSPYPPDSATATDAVLSMQRLPVGQYDPDNLDMQLNHSLLHPYLKSGNFLNMSNAISAQNEVLKNLIIYTASKKYVDSLFATGTPGSFSGDYNDLINRPILFSGDYNNLTNKPVLFSGNYIDLLDKPLTFIPSTHNHSESDIVNLVTDLSGKQEILLSGTNIKTVNGNSLLGSGDVIILGGLGLGYTLNVQALKSTPASGTTRYFGNLPKTVQTTANISKVYIRTPGTISIAEIYYYAGTAGTYTSGAWYIYLRLNNTTDYLIASTTTVASEKVFSNTNLNIPVVAGNYFEIKIIYPTFGTAPATAIWGGYIHIK